MIRLFGLKGWELLLFMFAVLVFLSSTTVYVSGISMRKYLLGWEDESGGEQVGKLTDKKGVIRRQLKSATEFQPLDDGAPLFNYDTLVTGSGTSATVLLDDGGTIELGSDTMVRLSFEEQLSLQGISRAANVQVVTGNVTGQATTSKITLRSQDKVVSITKEKKESVKAETAPMRKPPPKPVAQAPKAAPDPVAAPIPVAESRPSPSPSPSPIPKAIAAQVQLVAPIGGAHLAVEKGSQQPQLPVTLEWKVTPADRKLQVVLRKLGEKPQDPPLQIFNKIITPERGSAAVTHILDSPGEYEWEVLEDNGAPIAGGKTPTKARFVADAEFLALETMAPLVGGQRTDSNVYTGEVLTNFDITLRWKPYPGASGYRVQLAKEADAKKPLMEKEVSDSQYTFNKDKVYAGKLFYTVVGTLPSGFLPKSTSQPFNFRFLPPALVIPEDKSTVSALSLAGNNGGILMTWQKTNFTDGYDFELASDSNFKKIQITKKVKENFFVLKAPPPGRYWWRVRSFNKDTSSSDARPFQLTITR